MEKGFGKLQIDQLALTFLHALQECVEQIEYGKIGEHAVANSIAEILVKDKVYQIQITLVGDKKAYLPEDAPVIIEGMKMIQK